MGAWGIKTFENDDASDWIYDLEETSDLSLFEATFEAAREDYLEAPEGCTILAAAEVLLALQGRPRDGFPEEAANWVAKNKALDGLAVRQAAARAVQRVLAEDSELQELWEETDDYQAWKNDVLEIISLLQS